MICPNCGTELPNTANFCPNCGTRLTAIPQTPFVPGSQDDYGRQDQNVAGGPAATPPKKKFPVAAIVIIALVAVLVVGGIAGIVMFASGMRDTGSGGSSGIGSVSINTVGTHPVTFVVSIDGYSTDASRMPVHISGTDDEGNAVDKTIYLAYSGADVELKNGSYHAEAVGSPIAPDGTIYELPRLTIDFTLGTDLADGESYTMPQELSLVYVAIPAEEMTEQQIEDAVEWARKDEQGSVDVDELEKAAQKRMADASTAHEDGSKEGSDTDKAGTADQTTGNDDGESQNTQA